MSTAPINICHNYQNEFASITNTNNKTHTFIHRALDITQERNCTSFTVANN